MEMYGLPKPPGLRLIIGLFVIALAASLLFQGSRGLFDRDETRYAECAREMMVSGSWLVPLRGFQPHLTKPPLTYWAIAGGMALLGRNEWGVRLANGIAFAVTVLLIGLIGVNLKGPRYGIWAAAIYLSSILPFAASNIVTTDTLLVMWETAAMWAFLEGEAARSNSAGRRWFILMGVFWGLGFLTKGVAILPIAAVLLPYWIMRRRWFPLFPGDIWAIVAFLLTGFWWYVLVWTSHPHSFQLMLEQQIIGRLFNDLYHRNSAWYAPFYIYLPLLLLGLIPWLPMALRHLARQRPKRPAELFRKICHQRASLLITLWFAIPLLVFSMARSRLPLYILPVFPPMALAAALLLVPHLPGSPLTYRPFWATLLILCALKAVAAAVPFQQDARRMYEAFYRPLSTVDEVDLLGDGFIDGLSFYSGRAVERLPLNATKDDGAWREELYELASRPELFIVDLHKKSRLRFLHSLGLQTDMMAHYGRYGLFRVGRCCAHR